jgi:hypothetical protein
MNESVKEEIRDWFRVFLLYDIGVRFSSMPPMRIPCEVYRWLAMQREWQALPQMTIKYRYDPSDFKLKESKGNATAKSSTLEGAESAQFTPTDIKFGVAQLQDLSNKDTSSEEYKPRDIRTNNPEHEKLMATELKLNNTKNVATESRTVQCSTTEGLSSNSAFKAAQMVPKGRHSCYTDRGTFGKCTRLRGNLTIWGNSTKTQLIVLRDLIFTLC